MNGEELYHLPGFYEPFNAISHFIAAAVFVFLGWKIIARARGCRKRVLFVSIYSFTCVFLLSMSAVFHMLERDGAASHVLMRLDHAAIFMLIAGTFTGIHGTVFSGWFRWVPLVVVWSVAIASITLKTVFFESLPEWVGLALYIGLGWGVALTAIPIFRRHGLARIAPLFYGGIAYSLGALMEFMGWLVVIPRVVGPHEIWHIMVIAGALLHWWFVWDMMSIDLAEQELRKPTT